MTTTHTTTETASGEAQAPGHPANSERGPAPRSFSEGEKNKRAYWAAYRRAISGSPLMVYPNRADALLKGYADGLAEKRQRRAAARADAEAEELAEVLEAAGN